MKKVELVEAVATKAGLTKADATRAIDATFETITCALKNGDKVPLIGFGTFGVSERAERKRCKNLSRPYYGGKMSPVLRNR